MHHFVTSLDGRIRSMARTHKLLSVTQWHGISVRELVRRELAPYATGGNTEINGSEVILKVEAGQAMGMVLHELATNAAKYGALSGQKWPRFNPVGTPPQRTPAFSSGLRMAGDWRAVCCDSEKLWVRHEHNSQFAT